MTKIVKVKTGAKLEQLSSYSRIVMVDNWISVSNTAGRNPQTKEIPEDLREQTLRCLRISKMRSKPWDRDLRM